MPCRHGLTSFLFSRPSVLALDRLYFILEPCPGRKLATSYLFIFLSLGPKFLNLEDMGQGVHKRIDELSCGSIKREGAQQEC